MGTLAEKFRRVARRVRNKLGRRAAVLLYHRVSDTPDDPYLLRVRPQNFAQHLEVIRRHAPPMPLRRFVAEWRAGRMPHRAVVVTFDDGYADNLHTAKPLLEKHDVPATVFMTTGSVGRTREFWWDELEQIVLTTVSLPERLELDGRSWELECSAAGWTDRHPNWNLTHATDPTPRHRLLRGLHEFVRTMPHEAREAVLDRVADWAKATLEVRPPYRAMTDREAAELARGGLVEIGAHTVTHPSLPALSPAARLDEMTASRARMRDVTGGDVTSFAYPYGDHDHDTMLAAREAGFDVACACLDRIATPRAHPYALPRLDVLDWDGGQFAEKLEGWLRG